VRPEPDRAQRRRLWLILLLLEFLLFSGPFVLPLLQIAWCERHGVPVPERFPYVAWMLGAGVALLAAVAVMDVARRLRRLVDRRP
jgi:hypothetical protein